MAPTAPQPGGSVIVGIDGSDCAENALRWAVAKTAVLGPVTPVITFQLPTSFDLLSRSRAETDPTLHRAGAAATLDQVIADVDPSLAGRGRVIEAHPGKGLICAAKDGDLLVVGTRGRGNVTSSLLGSVSTYCVTHATVPVIVVPPDTATAEPLETILVGVDGSDNADEALRWALKHVAPDGTVVAAGAGSVFGYMAGEFDPPPEVLAKHLEDIVERAVDRVAVPGESGTRLVIRTDPTDARVALPAMATEMGADLLVLGARGVTGIPYLLLGSVSTALVHHPVVPTVIVPGAETSGPKR